PVAGVTGGITRDVTTGTSLVFTGLTNGTSYTFTVTATNAVGTSAASAASNAVIPATVPGPPTGATATRGNGSATVSWTAPVDTGGTPGTGYTVTASPGGATVNVSSGSATSAVVSGLNNGTSYTFTVIAINNVGRGAPSAASAAVTPITVPSAPLNVKTTV